MSARAEGMLDGVETLNVADAQWLAHVLAGSIIEFPPEERAAMVREFASDAIDVLAERAPYENEMARARWLDMLMRCAWFRLAELDEAGIARTKH